MHYFDENFDEKALGAGFSGNLPAGKRSLQTSCSLNLRGHYAQRLSRPPPFRARLSQRNANI